nr:hypothetical protein [Tanacetum cinerariifolium]
TTEARKPIPKRNTQNHNPLPAKSVKARRAEWIVLRKPIVEPLELSLSVSSSSNVTMLSRFADCQLSDRKAGSKGISAIFE